MFTLFLTEAAASKLIMAADILIALSPVCTAAQIYLDSKKD